jgi:multiple sugar transport system substrate-binding protein
MQRRTLLLATAGSILRTERRGAVAAERKKVTLWHIYNRDSDMIHVGIRMFNEQSADYQIEQRLVPYTQINPELIRATATGSPPDLVTINDPDVTSYAAQGQLVDLTDRVAASKTINMSVYYKGLQASGVWRGRRYSVAREINTLALYYNVDLFRAAGLDPDKPPATWSAVAAAAEKLTNRAKSIYGLGFCASQSEQSVFHFLPWLWQAGGAIDKLDQPPATAALQFWVDMVRKGYASRDLIVQPQAEVMSAFLAQSYAMAVGGPWELPRFAKEGQFNWGITELPVKDDKNIHASSLGGFHFVIPQGAKEVDGALKVIELMSNPVLFQQGWNDNGLLAPRTDIEVTSPAWPKAYAIYRQQVTTAIQRGPHPQWPTLSRPLQVAIQEALTGTKTPEAALQGAARQIQPILNKTPL